MASSIGGGCHQQDGTGGGCWTEQRGRKMGKVSWISEAGVVYSTLIADGCWHSGKVVFCSIVWCYHTWPFVSCNHLRCYYETLAKLSTINISFCKIHWRSYSMSASFWKDEKQHVWLIHLFNKIRAVTCSNLEITIIISLQFVGKRVGKTRDFVESKLRDNILVRMDLLLDW